MNKTVIFTITKGEKGYNVKTKSLEYKKYNFPVEKFDFFLIYFQIYNLNPDYEIYFFEILV